ncbi:tail fiber domain-containing protein [Flavilitoribacter nigricans]|uniref:Peptidase S74 domain-containing protein n=1 Tax=Flavilitoribacter nigricans (strain ATCC 23147 / DSM 23189 / NBRC 102662 / NCIMB 1420 / SS-2) TaxID=1122177 RepID=A0A2D0N021_FLAN2|nr:tail fiber domain-containing protein [Flavilitoribacter nigricans]PHN01892.1 hypothetical protein CRP01_35235 [Flavilitoribacter nigricans DSM 23189 = NBRC 102662]
MTVDNKSEIWGLYIFNRAFSTSTNGRIGLNILTDHNTDYQQIGIKNRVNVRSTSSAVSYGILNDTYLDGSGSLSAGIYNRAWTSTSSSGAKIGLYTSVGSEGTGPRYALYSSGGTYAGFFSGNVHINGVLVQTSDRDLKEEIQDVEDPSEQFLQIKARKYKLKKEKDKKTHYGFIAQEIETLFPELVREVVSPGEPIYGEQENEEGEMQMTEIGREPDQTYKSINYIELMPILVKVIQQQESKILELQERIEKLEKK